ncbi:MAG: hypothetical protein V4717_21155 [Bacteroidota bacterium]
MIIDDFLKQLQSLAPNPVALEKSGFTSGFIAKIIKAYNLERKREQNVDFTKQGNPIIELVNQYDAHLIKFGDYSFNSIIEAENSCKVFCTGSSTSLGIVDDTGSVIEFSFDDYTVLQYCASDSSAFLQALLIYLELKSLRLQNIIDPKDNQKNQEFLDKCVAAAGGIGYFNFYKSLIF